jgi:hypothetical protein
MLTASALVIGRLWFDSVISWLQAADTAAKHVTAICIKRADFRTYVIGRGLQGGLFWGWNESA